MEMEKDMDQTLMLVVNCFWQFDAASGFQRFIAEHFQLETAPEKDKERALERLKKLYDQVLYDYVEDLVASDQLN
jgi:hypothetical protein